MADRGESGSLSLRPALGRMWLAYFWNSPLESPLGELVHPPPAPPPCRALMQVLDPRLWTVLGTETGAVPPSSPATHHIPALYPAAAQPSELRAASLLAPLLPVLQPQRVSKMSCPSQLQILPWLPSTLGKNSVSSLHVPDPCGPPWSGSHTRRLVAPPNLPSPLPPQGLTEARWVSDWLS